MVLIDRGRLYVGCVSVLVTWAKTPL